MTGIKNIIFDFGGVLADWDRRYFYRDRFKDDEKMEYFLANVATVEWNAEFDRGLPFSEGIASLQEQYPEWADDIAVYRQGWETMLGDAVQDGVELLKECKAKGYRLFGLTNWSAETFPIAYAKFDFFKLFEGIVVSGEEKLIKPDPRIYRVLLERYGLKAEECVFIDDNPANVAAAEALGIRGVLFDGAARVRKELWANCSVCRSLDFKLT